MNIREIQEEIINEFKDFDSWIDRYKYVIKLGKKLPSISSEYKTEENLIKDCQVKTWFQAVSKDGKVFYHIDSQSTIIKGIIVLMKRVLSGQKPEDIKKTNLYFINRIFSQDDFLPLRTDNLQRLIDRIKSEAESYIKN